MVARLVLMPVFGWVADKVGPLKLMWASTLGILFCAYPLFSLMHHHDAWVDLLAELGFVLLLVPFMASSPAGLCALLPKGVRCTVLSVGFNLSMGLLGGTTPLVVEYMRKTTHQDMTPALYLVAGAVVHHRLRTQVQVVVVAVAALPRFPQARHPVALLPHRPAHRPVPLPLPVAVLRRTRVPARVPHNDHETWPLAQPA
jgi:nitrate/nitrite transporter NarK